MKQIITVLFLIISTFSFAQTKKVLTVNGGTALATAPVASTTQAGLIKIGANLSVTNGTLNATAGGTGGGSSQVGVLTTVGGFAAFSDTVATVIVTDTLRGGTFLQYTGTDIVDNGMVFIDALSRKWRRETLGEKIYVKWYGISPNTSITVSTAPEIEKAIDYVNKHKIKYGTVQLSATPNSTWYYISKQLDLKGIKFEGSGGTVGNPGTMIKVGYFTAPVFDIRTVAADVRNIGVSHIAGPSTDSGHHTFKIRVPVRFDNVVVYNNPNGHGFDITGCGPALSTAADSIFGNPDHAVFTNIYAYNCLTGVYLEGCDANAIYFRNSVFADNKKWGVYDNGFLGNTYFSCKFDRNGQVSNSGARVGDTTFYPVVDSVYNIVNKYPPTNPTYWYRAKNPTTNHAVWNSTTKYWGGGPLWANNANSNHGIIASSVDTLQGPVVLGNRSAWYEGIIRSGIINGMWQTTRNSTTYFQGAAISSDAIDTKRLKVGNAINGFTVDLIKSPLTTSSQELWLPNQTGTIALSNIVQMNRDPTTADIENVDSRIWNNTVTGTLRLYVNNGGTLVILAEYIGP